MAIVRFDPFRLDPFGRQFMRSFFDDQDEWVNVSGNNSLNVYEEDNKVVVETAAPGIPTDKVDVTYEDGVLRISAHSEEKEEEKRKNRVAHRMQRTVSFNYATYLPRPIEADKITADVENGVITVTAPIAEAAKARKIPVKAKGR